MSATVAELLAALGGVARFGALRAVVAREDIEAALAGGDIVRDARGVYALPDVDESLRVATRLGGALSLTSAALHHGWGLKSLPDKPHAMVVDGWIVLRLTYEDVMLRPDEVRVVLAEAMALAQLLVQRLPDRTRAA